MHEPVDGGVGDGFWHELVEPGGMQVRGEGYGPFFVGGIDDPIQGFGGVGGDRQQSDVVDCAARFARRSSSIAKTVV